MKLHAAARAGIALCPGKPRLVDLSALKLGRIHAELFKRQELRSGAHGTACDHNGGDIDTCHADQIAGHSFITARQKYTAVEGRGISMDFNHVGNHFTAGKAEVDAVSALTLSVTDICAEIARAVSARVSNAAAGRLCQPIQMARSGMAVAEGTLHNDLRLGEVFRLPPGAEAQRVKLGGDPAHFLTDQFSFHVISPDIRRQRE